MRHRLEHLENNEAVLLMYLFDELPAEDRAEVDRMLQTDSGLRSQFEQLRRSHLKVQAMVDEADRHTVMPLAPAAAERQIVRLMRQWTTRRMSEEGASHYGRRGLPIWLYPLATAAAVLVGTMVWWGFRDGVNTLPAPVSEFADAEPQEIPMMQMEVQFALLRSFETVDELSDVEQQLQVIADRRDDSAPVLSLDPMSR